MTGIDATGQTGQLVPYPVEEFPAELRGGVVTIGNFDGVHRGHAALLGQTVDAARSTGVRPVVLTFSPHPRTFFRPAQPVFRLTPLTARARLFKAVGIEALAVAQFDADFAAMSAEDFIDGILRRQLGASGVVIGFNFRFGKGRAGTPEMLAEAGRAHGFPVSVVEPVGQGEAIYTSSSVRAFLREGDVAAAAEVLGYHWFVMGEVVAGEKRGRELGFPTANISLWPDFELRHGIYAVRFRTADGSIHNGVASYGRRPTFDDGPPLLETYIFDFDGDLYGQPVSVSFAGWIRAEEKFDSVEALVATMHRDADTARQCLAATPARGLDQVLGTF